MASIVELRKMSNQKLQEMLENSQEEMFNLRFQRASARLGNLNRLRQVRCEIAQLQTVLRLRQLAVAAAAQQPEVADALTGQQWTGQAEFNYERSLWEVDFLGDGDRSLITAEVDLNQKGTGKTRRSRRGQ